jgi:hypothetical protein
VTIQRVKDWKNLQNFGRKSDRLEKLRETGKCDEEGSIYFEGKCTRNETKGEI